MPLLWQKSNAYKPSAPHHAAEARVAHLQELENIESNIVVDKFGVEASKVGIVDVFEDKGGRLALHQK